MSLKLDPIKAQFSRTWRIFVAGWWKFLIFVGLPRLAYYGIKSSYFEPYEGSLLDNPLFFMTYGYLFFILIIAIVVFYFISGAGLIYSLDKAESITLKEAYRKGWDYGLSYFWVWILFVLVMFGGLLLLVVPGLIFIIRYGFAPYVLIHKGPRGWKALRESKRLVRGYWWPIFGRYMLISVFFIVFLILSAFVFWGLPSKAVMAVINPLWIIFVTIYSFVIFQDLEAIKQPETSAPPPIPPISSPPPLPDSR
jgi:hypothetical protein